MTRPAGPSLLLPPCPGSPPPSQVEAQRTAEPKAEAKQPAPPDGTGGAAGGDKTGAPAAAPRPGEVEVQFLNGSTVRMTLDADTLEVLTPYGPLTVPLR